jgi:hypothetical protein
MILVEKNLEIKLAIRSVIERCYIISKELDNPDLGKENVTDIDDPEQVSVISEMKRSGVFFPGRPVVRNLKQVDIGSSSEGKCTKNYQSNTRLGSGIVLFWCAKHRVCLGWVFLKKAESLEIVYQTLLTRFPVMPKVICYDNACNLSEYCYNRAPRYENTLNNNYYSFFINSIFIVDGFHYKGHVNCSHGYNSSNLGIMSQICSVIHEQKNAKLAKLKIPSLYIRFDCFLSLIRALTSLMNHNETRPKLKKC